MNIRKFFKFLEQTYNKTKVLLEKRKISETAFAVVSSPDFVDPAEHPGAINNGVNYQSSS